MAPQTTSRSLARMTLNSYPPKPSGEVVFCVVVLAALLAVILVRLLTMR
jgi:hypothetical protein